MTRKQLYLKGLFPAALLILISGMELTPISFSWHLNGWDGYYLLSYLIVFPTVYRRTFGSFNQTADLGEKLQHPHDNADQEAVRTGSSYANTGHFGVARIGDAGDHEFAVVRWGTSLIYRLFLVAAGIFVLAYQWVKQRR
ncbi:hypothetical protein [Levilactobacillus acidifarinae]|nr:hypothetical protein [Levilactobacillus acidifarinae]GEO69429.1 hypothetical protein LAC03_13390 [Levilactobacillus acidifarinae]